jgi:hypothetical protein
MAADLGGEVAFAGNYLSDGVPPNTGIAPGPHVTFATLAGRKENGTSGDTAGYLSFAVNRSNNSVNQAMRITSTGLVGIGTTTPGTTLDIQTYASPAPSLRVGSTCVAGPCSSDKNLKEDIHYMSGSLALLEQLKPSSYRYKGDVRGQVGYGLIAQDVERVMPGLVSRDAKGFRHVDYSPLTMMLVDAVQQLSRRTGPAMQSEKMERLERENAQLRGRLERVEAALQRLESTR